MVGSNLFSGTAASRAKSINLGYFYEAAYQFRNCNVTSFLHKITLIFI